MVVLRWNVLLYPFESIIIVTYSTSAQEDRLIFRHQSLEAKISSVLNTSYNIQLSRRRLQLVANLTTIAATCATYTAAGYDFRQPWYMHTAPPVIEASFQIFLQRIE